jgi:hypothetical protein
MNDEETFEQIAEVEWLKLAFDWGKHLSTLSTGSIVLMVTFLEKIATKAEWQFLVVAAFIAFAACILSTVGMQFSYLIRERYRGTHWIEAISFVVCVISFPSGILSLVVFAVRNLHAHSP